MIFFLRSIRNLPTNRTIYVIVRTYVRTSSSHRWESGLIAKGNLKNNCGHTILEMVDISSHLLNYFILRSSDIWTFKKNLKTAWSNSLVPILLRKMIILSLLVENIWNLDLNFSRAELLIISKVCSNYFVQNCITPNIPELATLLDRPSLPQKLKVL